MLSHKKYLLKALTSLCFIATQLTACYSHGDKTSSRVGKGDSPLIDVRVDECAVYSELLKVAYVDNNANPLVIENVSSLDGLNIKRIDQELSDLHRILPPNEVKELANRFVAANETLSMLVDCFDLNVQTILLRKEEVDEITKAPNGWSGFLTKYPHQSLIWLSRIAFNHEKNKALVYTGSESGGKSGTGTFVILIKENNAWVIKYTIVSWKS